MTELPEPVDTQICSVCKIEWSKHVKRFEDRNYRWRIYEQMEDDPYEDPPEEQPHPIDLRDCVELLLVVNQGPMGYQGPMGVQGIQGPKGDTESWDPRLTPGWNSKGW